MMKKVLSWIFLLLIIASLAGCKKEGETPQAKSREYGELRVVTNLLYRSVMLNTAEAQNGYYEFVDWNSEMYAHEETSPWMHTGNIVYIDYATKTRVFLCGTPGCAHNNEQCTSYIRYPAAISLFTNSTGTQLFLMAMGASGGEVYGEDDLGRIYTMNMDGSNRREIYRLQPNENFELMDMIVADETHLIVCVAVTKSAEDGGYRRELREIDLIDGKITPILELGSLEGVISAFDDTIVMCNWEDDTSAEYYGYSVKHGTTTIFTKMAEGYEAADGHYLFFSQEDGEDTAEIRRYNLITGEEDVFSHLPSVSGRSVSVRDCFDGKVTWSFIINVDAMTDKTYKYILDCDTGEYRERTLTFETNVDGVYTRFVPILAEHGDQFLVLADSVESTMTLVNREGIPFVYDYTNRPVYALMSKEDYWNNIPNYTFIEDTVGL